MSEIQINKKNTTIKVGVLDKALSIIEVLQNQEVDLGLTEISKLSNVNKSTCYRILQTLMTEDLIETGDRPGTYKLGIGFIKLGEIVKKRINIRQIALPYLKQLTSITGNTSYLSNLNSMKAVCVERIDSKDIQVLALEVGDAWPLYQGAASRAILAYLDDNTIEEVLSNPIKPLTSKTLTTKEDYLELVNKIRIKGYSTSYEDVTLGVASIGAPIFNYEGHVIGAISLSSIIQRIPLEKEENIAKHVVVAADNISRELGWANN